MQTVQDELAAVAQINECFAHQGLPDVSSADKERLKLLITRLRNQEQQLTFQQGLKQAQQAFSGHDGDYSAENFAFGSTPFPTWMTLFTQRPVLDALARAPDTATLTVFGSSSGSLVLFATIALGINATGVEILPFLHNEAEQTRQALQVATHKCHFICADMLTVPVHKTSIVLLTSQCWDAQLYQQLQLKLETELQPGALVIDYKDALQSSSLFQMVQHVPHQRVSWTNSQSLFIFQRTIG
ncbi:unnamed protein product [Phytophthora lilii]|uniref:Unnamed protein product n=1 Tax=Phytophthora lilii TaxID=2077276 RepID=A0A9W6WQ93_9STRA|nr:unnamed protein product [Phytophthora lilii]